jgi:hypothetical protein
VPDAGSLILLRLCGNLFDGLERFSQRQFALQPGWTHLVSAIDEVPVF